MDLRLLKILGGNEKYYPHILQSKYPRVLAKIMLLWESSELDDYFLELMVNKRGFRAGFPPEVASEIIFLNLVHSILHPSITRRDIWDKAAVLEDYAPRVFDKYSGILASLRAAESSIRPEMVSFLEQLANKTANVNVDSAVQQQHHLLLQATKNIPAARTSRRPISWGKIVAGLFVVILAAIFAVPYLLPMQDYETAIEQLLAGRLKQPAHVGHLAGRLFPTPRLELSDVSIGDAKQIQVRHAHVNFTFPAIFSAERPIASLELQGVLVNGAALQPVSAWLRQVAAGAQYQIARIELSQGSLDAGGVQLSDVGGKLNFNQGGDFAQASLNAEGNKFALDINATPGNKLQMEITVHGSALPLLPNWDFDELIAKGELTKDEFVITDLDAHIFGGMLLGDARINWRQDWDVQGTLVAKTISMQNISTLLGGDLDGRAHFQMHAASLEKLPDTAVMDGIFVIKRGVVNGMDFIETARLRSNNGLSGGRTRFDELSGDMSYADEAYHFRQIKMNAGVLNATGTLDIAKQQLSGKASADLAMRSAMGAVALQIGGTTSNPSLLATR